MTVDQLIDLLSTMPPESPVAVEGCDCYGWAYDVELYDDNSNTVMITRSDTLIER